MNNKELIKQLKLFKDKAFCHHSHYRAGQIWKQIVEYIPKEFKRDIQTEWQHVYLGHEFTQACAALNTEVKKCIDYLEKED